MSCSAKQPDGTTFSALWFKDEKNIDPLMTVTTVCDRVYACLGDYVCLLTSIQLQTANKTDGTTIQTSTLTTTNALATQSGIYACTFYYVVPGFQYPVTSNTAFLVVQGMISSKLTLSY